MAILLPTLRYVLRKAAQGAWVDPLTYTAGSANGAGPGLYSNQQAQAEIDYSLSKRVFPLSVTDGGTAATAIAEEAVYAIDPALTGGLMVVGATIATTAAFSASATTYAGVVLTKRTTVAGVVGAAQIILANSTNTSDLVLGAAAGSNAFRPYSLTPAGAQTASSGAAIAAAAANATCLPGDVLTFALTKASTGTALGNVAITLILQEL